MDSERDLNPIPSPNAQFTNRESQPEPPTALDSMGSHVMHEIAINSQTDLPSVIELNSISEEDAKENSNINITPERNHNVYSNDVKPEKLLNNEI